MSEALDHLKAAEDALTRLRAALETPPLPTRPAPVEPPPAPAQRLPPPPPNPHGRLANAKAFYDSLKSSDSVFGPRLLPDQVRGTNALIAMGAGRLPLPWMAYVLATAYHESGHVMIAVPEKGSGRDRDGDGWDDYLEQYDTGPKAARLGNTPEADGDGVLYAGRGPVQITGRRNYAFASDKLLALGVLRPGESLIETPDLALDLIVGAAICVFGMLEGWFTGKRLNDFIAAKAHRDHYRNARRIVNGTDKADLIAGYALEFDAALKAGDWS